MVDPIIERATYNFTVKVYPNNTFAKIRSLERASVVDLS